MASAAVYVLMAATTAVSAYSSYESGKTQQKAAEMNAKAAKQKAAYDETIHREKVKRLLSTQRAIAGSSGVELTGSPLLALEDTAKQGELDALAIRYGGSVTANQDRNEGSAAAAMGRNKAGTTLLSGLTSGVSYYNRGK